MLDFARECGIPTDSYALDLVQRDVTSANAADMQANRIELNNGIESNIIEYIFRRSSPAHSSPTRPKAHGT